MFHLDYQLKKRFSFRKYSVGLISVMVGVVMLGSPQTVSADEVTENVPQSEVLLTTSDTTNLSSVVSFQEEETNLSNHIQPSVISENRSASGIRRYIAIN